jgi:hypothetical protein
MTEQGRNCCTYKPRGGFIPEQLPILRYFLTGIFQFLHQHVSSNFGGAMPPDFDSEDYWQERFSVEYWCYLLRL